MRQDKDIFDAPKLWVHADYVRPSNKIEQYKFISGSKVKHQEYYVPMVRKAELPFVRLEKSIKNAKVIKFDKGSSVFKAWQ